MKEVDEILNSLTWTGDDLAYLENIKMALVRKQRYDEAGIVRSLIKEIQSMTHE